MAILAVLLVLAEVVDTPLPHAACAWFTTCLPLGLRAASHYCRAVADSSGHAVLGLSVWLAVDPIWLPKPGATDDSQLTRRAWLIERGFALLSGSLVDLDHFIAAR